MFSARTVAERATARRYAVAVTTFARALSILGHPLLVLPAAALLALQAGGAGAGMGRIAVGLALFSVAVMAWSWWQVRRGRWSHVDASSRHERRSLNRFLLIVLLLGSLLAWRVAPAPLALGLALSAAIVFVAIATTRWCKLSLHVSIAVYAAVLLWQLSPWATLAGLAFAAALAWSRLALARHAPRDLVAGALAGAIAGLAFWSLSRAIAGA